MHGSKPIALFDLIYPSRDRACHHRKKLNNYLLCAKLGSGATATVYLAEDQRTHEKYAIKRFRLRDLARSGNGVGQLEREIRLIRLFLHPNILKLHEVLHDQANGEVCLVLEHAEKGSLGGFIERGDRLSHPAVFSVLKQVAAALKYLHDAGYVHQDVKPCNILLDSARRAILSDFGIGHSFHSAGMVVGSPEALDVECDDGCLTDEGPQKEDVWALGVTLYQCLFRKFPYVGNNLYEIVVDIKAHELEIPPGTDPAIAELLRRMLAVDPARRCSVDDLLAHALIRDAPDRAADLPPIPGPKEKNGDIVQIDADVLPGDCSFAGMLTPPRRFSYACQAGGLGGLTRTKGDALDDIRPRVKSLQTTKAGIEDARTRRQGEEGRGLREWASSLFGSKRAWNDAELVMRVAGFRLCKNVIVQDNAPFLSD
jgi:serine/threonine protein kinase